jgi:hypothetical protein
MASNFVTANPSEAEVEQDLRYTFFLVHMRNSRPQSKPRSKPSKRGAVKQVLPRSLAAKETLKEVFDCFGLLTDDEILERVRDGLPSGRGRHSNSCAASARLISLVAGQCLESFWSSFKSLNEADKDDVARAIRSGLQGYAKKCRGGRPKGAQAQKTGPRIRLVAALQFLGCSNKGMMPFVYGTERHQETRTQTFKKFLRRQRISIDQACTQMTEALARDIIKANVNIELAIYIVKSVL